jgi:hypothetical protein
MAPDLSRNNSVEDFGAKAPGLHTAMTKKNDRPEDRDQEFENKKKNLRSDTNIK